MLDLVTRSDAKTLGYRVYFTGIPCPAGHICERRVHNGECVQCARLAAGAYYAARKSDPAFREKNNQRALRNYESKSAERREEKRIGIADWIARAKSQDLTILTRDEARRSGSARFFIGAPCPTGHISPRHTSDGACIACKRSRTKHWRASNPEATRAQDRSYYSAAPERFRARSRAKHARRRDDTDFQKANAARARRWAKANRNKHRANLGRRRARQKAALGEFSADDVKAIRDKQKDRCAYCRDRLKGRGEIDHIHPLVPRDGSDPGRNDATNLQLLCRPCNRRKHNKHPADFARELGLLI